MNSSQFYLTLPSNSKAENTASVYTTTLPQYVHLEGNWECALVVIIYPNSWFNVTEEENFIRFFDIDNKVRQVVKVPRGRYETIQDLINTLNFSLDFISKKDNIPYNMYMSLTYDVMRKIVQLRLNRDKIRGLKFTKNIYYMLGFRENDILSIDYSTKGEQLLNAYYPADMNCAMNYLYIYCDILEPQIIGTALAPLLQVVNIEGKYTDLVSRIYTAPHYVPVLRKTFNTIEINIKSDQNKPIDFTFGKTITKMHFRKIKPPYF
jgi:hypothetical protein